MSPLAKGTAAMTTFALLAAQTSPSRADDVAGFVALLVLHLLLGFALGWMMRGWTTPPCPLHRDGKGGCKDGGRSAASDDNDPADYWKRGEPPPY